jgi:Ca2+-transporting ATPase
MMSFYNREISEIITSLKSDLPTGLKTEEVKRRLAEHGYNQLASKKRKSFVRIFFEQFKSFMIIILLIAAAISGIVGVMEGEGLLDTFVILICRSFPGAEGRNFTRSFKKSGCPAQQGSP